MVKRHSLKKYPSRFVVIVTRRCYKEQESLKCLGNIRAAKRLQMDVNTCSLKVERPLQRRGGKAVFLGLFLVSNKLVPFIRATGMIQLHLCMPWLIVDKSLHLSEQGALIVFREVL